MSTMAIKSAVTMDHVKSGKKADFVSRFKKYMEDNVAYFAAGSAMMTGNGYAFCHRSDSFFHSYTWYDF